MGQALRIVGENGIADRGALAQPPPPGGDPRQVREDRGVYLVEHVEVPKDGPEHSVDQAKALPREPRPRPDRLLDAKEADAERLGGARIRLVIRGVVVGRDAVQDP